MIKKVMFNPPYTIVIWEDKTKTIVKCENEIYDPEKGLAMAMAKRLFGNHGYYYDVFKKWVPKEKPTIPEEKPVLGIDLSPEASPHTYSVKELAEKLGVSEDTVRRDIKKGAYPTAKKAFRPTGAAFDVFGPAGRKGWCSGYGSGSLYGACA